MIPVIVPTTDVNSETCLIRSWHVADRSAVRRDEPIVDVETSKTAIEVYAPGDGLILRACEEGDVVPIDVPIAYLFTDADALSAFHAKQEAARNAAGERPATSHRASKKAEKLAADLGIDLAELDTGKLITTKDVKAAVRQTSVPDYGAMAPPLTADAGTERVLIIGAGLGATQVLDIFESDRAKQGVALLDDDSAMWGSDVFGVPVIGGSDRLEELFEKKAFDTAIVSIGRSVPVRTRFREQCGRLGIPLTNAIDRTSKLATDATIGTGNVICAFCHFGVAAAIGDNNFFSAYNSFDHHTTLGSDISTGPGCMASALVDIGDRVRMGTGIFIEPHHIIGAGAQIASGAIILQSVPADHAVKMKTGGYVVVPIQGS